MDKRYCPDCGHRGAGDDNDEVAVCLQCGETQPIDCDDYCPECDQENVMGIACPVCEGEYRLDDEQ